MTTRVLIPALSTALFALGAPAPAFAQGDLRAEIEASEAMVVAAMRLLNGR